MPTARGAHPRAAVPLRRLEVGRRGLRQRPGRCRLGHPACGVPAGQRLRSAPEPARRGRRGLDLHATTSTAAARPRSTGRASRRATTSTSATSSARCSPPRAGRDVQHRHRRRDRRDRASGGSCARRPASTSSRSWPTCVPASCSTAASTRAAPSASSAGRRRCRSPTACGSPTLRWSRNSRAASINRPRPDSSVGRAHD